MQEKGGRQSARGSVESACLFCGAQDSRVSCGGVDESGRVVNNT